MANPQTVTRSQMAGMSAGKILQGQIAPSPYNDRYAKIFGSQLTPASATQVLANADLGYMWYLADLLDEILERDAHLQSILAKRTMRVASAEWEIIPPANTGKRAQSIADWCTARLNDIEAKDDLGRSFTDGICDLLGAIYHGRSVLESVWNKDGRYWYPETLSFVHSRRCAYTSDWKMHLWDAQGTSTSIYLPPMATRDNSGPFGEFPGIPVDAFPAGKFVAHRPRIRGVYPTREGIGRVVCWYSIFKRFDIRDWVAFAEWAGRGLRIGTFSTGTLQGSPERATPEHEEALRQAIDDLSSAISIVIPDTTSIDVKGMPATNDVHEKLLYACNNEMTKVVLLETLTTEVGVTGGNRALGEVHNEIGRMLAMQDAKQLAATLRRDMLRPMVQRSFGVNAPVPEIYFHLEAQEDLDAWTRRIVSMVKDCGLEVGQGWVREQLGIPGLDAANDLPLMAAKPSTKTKNPGKKRPVAEVEAAS